MAPIAAKKRAPPVGVLIVDDQPTFRRAARDVVEAAGPEFALLGEAVSGEQALAAVEELQPDLVLVEVRMHGMGGIEISKRLTAAHPGAVVVLVTLENPLDLSSEVGFCGAADVIRKQELEPALLRRLWQAHRRRPR